MKENESIDNIFFEGLEGKSIKKPERYWKDVSLNILKNISKPWWSSFTMVAIGTTLITAIVAIVWYNFNNSSTNQIEPKQIDIIATDSTAFEKDSLLDSASPTNPVNTDTLLNVIQKEMIKPAEKKVLPEVPRQEKSARQPDSQRLSGSKDSVVLAQPDSVRFNTIDSINAIKSKQLPPKELNKKKVPTVIIIQDTVIVTDTIKIDKKK